MLYFETLYDQLKMDGEKNVKNEKKSILFDGDFKNKRILQNF